MENPKACKNMDMTDSITTTQKIKMMEMFTNAAKAIIQSIMNFKVNTFKF